MTPSRAAGLDRLLDEAEIRRILISYCRGVDRCLEEVIAASYHPGAKDIHGSFQGLASDYAHWAITTATERYDATQHYVTNIEYEFSSADIAQVQSAFFAVHRPADNHTRLLLLGGRYVDVFTRRPDWRISDRTVVVDWSSVLDSSESFPGIDCFVHGARGLSRPQFEGAVRGEACVSRT